MSLLPETSVTQAPFNERATDLLTGLFRDLTAFSRDAYLPDLAMALNSHAIRLAEVGRRPEALSVSWEAVTAYRELVALSRDVYLPGLAASLNNHAARLAEMGRQAEALTVSQEAVDLRRELTTLNRDAHLPDLVQSLAASGYVHAFADQRGESVPALWEALTLIPELPDHERDMITPAVLGLLRDAYEADPGGITKRFTSLTGEEPQEWLKKQWKGDERQ